MCRSVATSVTISACALCSVPVSRCCFISLSVALSVTTTLSLCPHGCCASGSTCLSSHEHVRTPLPRLSMYLGKPWQSRELHYMMFAVQLSSHCPVCAEPPACLFSNVLALGPCCLLADLGWPRCCVGVSGSFCVQLLVPALSPASCIHNESDQELLITAQQIRHSIYKLQTANQAGEHCKATI